MKLTFQCSKIILLEPSHAHSFTYYQWMPLNFNGRPESVQPRKESFLYGSLQKKFLPTHALREETLQRLHCRDDGIGWVL
jgi:hypothetical protein